MQRASQHELVQAFAKSLGRSKETDETQRIAGHLRGAAVTCREKRI
jgi:hypothetical protein